THPAKLRLVVAIDEDRCRRGEGEGVDGRTVEQPPFAAAKPKTRLGDLSFLRAFSVFDHFQHFERGKHRLPKREGRRCVTLKHQKGTGLHWLLLFEACLAAQRSQSKSPPALLRTGLW